MDGFLLKEEILSRKSTFLFAEKCTSLFAEKCTLLFTVYINPIKIQININISNIILPEPLHGPDIILGNIYIAGNCSQGMASEICI
jgi:hypothetical protein